MGNETIDQPVPPPNCEQLRHHYSESHTKFSLCAINHAEPVTYCTECFHIFKNFSIAYINFTSAPECNAKYVDNDRLNIIQTMFANSRNLWNAGSCSGECVRHRCGNRKPILFIDYFDFQIAIIVQRTYWRRTVICRTRLCITCN